MTRARPRPVVVDASVAVKWVIPEDHSTEALALLRDHLEARIEAHAPSLLLLEAASALRRYTLHGTITPHQAAKALRLIAEAELRLAELDEALAQEALGLSLELGVTVYDAAYLALARRLRAPLYTADERLLANPRARRAVDLRHVSTYPGP